MVKIKNSFALILVLLLTMSFAVGCGGPKTTPEESAKIFLDVIFKNDKTNMEKIGLKEEEFNEFRKLFEDGIMEGMSGKGIDESILNEEVKATLKNDMLTGLAKVEYEVGSASKDKDIAKVEVKIKGFDMAKVSEKAKEKLEADFAANPSMTEAEILQTSFKYVGEFIAAGTLGEEQKSVNLTLTKEDAHWVPGENDIVAVMTVIMGM